MKGIPSVRYFSKGDFEADHQFWDACQGQDGVMYFSNNDGVIVYDGERWHKVPLPNHSSSRCLSISDNGTVYTGGYNQLGIIVKDNLGNYQYESLVDSLQLGKEKLENVWKIHTYKEKVFVRTFKQLIIINGKSTTVLPAIQKFKFSYFLNGHYYVQEEGEGIFRYDEEHKNFEKLIDDQPFQNQLMVGCHAPAGSRYHYLVSEKGYIYRFDPKTKEFELIKKLLGTDDRASYSLLYKENQILIGTLNSKVISYHIDLNDTLSSVNPFQELKAEAVHSLYLNQQDNLWVMLNNGLNFVEMDAPIKTVFDKASVYDLKEQYGKIYLATNKGLYYSSHSQKGNTYLPAFEKAHNIGGQVWSLASIGGKLYVNHDNGLFLIENNQTKRIGQVEGVWKTIPSQQGGKYLICTYSGIYTATLNDSGQLQVEHKIEGFEESTRDIQPASEPNTYWVCHGYKGVYRIHMDEELSRVTSLEHFTEKDGLPSIYNINVHIWKGNEVFTTNSGTYSFNTQKLTFEPFNSLNEILGTDKNIRQLIAYKSLNWFIKDDELGYFREGEKELHTDLFAAFKGSFNRSMEKVVPLSDNQVLVGTRSGLYLASIRAQENLGNIPTVITNIRYEFDTTTRVLPTSGEQLYKLPNQTRQLRIEFSCPQLLDKGNIRYSYKLDDIDQNWKEWDETSFAAYNYLRAGTYTFNVRGKSPTGEIAHATSIRFQILPKWYETTWAIVAFICLSLLIAYLGFRQLRKNYRVKEQKIRAESTKAQKLLQLELEQLKLTQEKLQISQAKEALEQDVIDQSKELVNFTTLLARKNQVFLEQREQLQEFEKQINNERNRKVIKQMIRTLNIHLAEEKHIQVFDAEFERIHNDFFHTLREQFPELNQRELRLCAFIKMDLTNKEIAPLLNISTRGVESARYRLRKKLQMSHEDALADFLKSFMDQPQHGDS
ncbi:triple tyrosine motif-containing protein [Limibacter armeniacum]|uniref:helix-turn-helix and ligand-binding sensor domain-containing protein n=1 Tax=Limibacter armeniacum TaxID=466084 RepID=UPI002FE6BECF